MCAGILLDKNMSDLQMEIPEEEWRKVRPGILPKLTYVLEIALGVLYAAKKCDIADLESLCNRCLKSQIQCNNVVSIVQTAQLLEVFDLRDKALSFIIR